MVDEIGGPDRRLSSWPPALAAAIASDFHSDAADDAAIDATITRYLASPAPGAAPYALCPHTAAGVYAAERLLQRRAAAGGGVHRASTAAGDVVVLATAHPAKFASGTPSLAGLYAGVFDGDNSGSSSGDASADPAPPLPPQLRGLAAKPRRVTSLRAALPDVIAFVDAAVPVPGRRSS